MKDTFSLVIAILILCCSLVPRCVCIAPDESREALRKAGFTDITIGEDRDMFVCDEELAATHFKARNPHGDLVEGTVCCGVLLKGCTIRF